MTTAFEKPVDMSSFVWECSKSLSIKNITNYLFDGGVSKMFKDLQFVRDVWRLYKLKYNLPFDIENSKIPNDDPNTDFITDENALEMYEVNIRDALRYPCCQPFKFEYDNNHNPSCGGTNVTICYSSSLKTPYAQLFEEIKGSSTEYTTLHKASGYDFEEENIIIRVPSGYVFIKYDDDNASCAGHHVSINIKHDPFISFFFKGSVSN